MKSDEFPLLKLHGLYAAEIRGDGNCLFNALSDQLYGTQDQHHEIRARTITYMREHADYFKLFVEVYAGGGVRRNPKRKNAGGYSSNNTLRASPEELDRVFQEHIERMSKGGAWGDNMEIVAFSNAFDVNVKIYQHDFAYEVTAAHDGADKATLHIAYHTWEHYSSIRNIDGPHDGLPHVSPHSLSPEDEQIKEAILSQPQSLAAWQIKSVEDAVAGMPNPPDHDTIIRTLEECRGNIDSAFEKLLTADEQLSISSQHSSSVEREVDGSSDEFRPGPSKKQDRRMSRATMKHRDERRKQQIASKLDTFGDSLEALVKATSSSPPSRPRTHIIIEDSDDEDMSPAPLRDGDTSSSSEYSEERTSGIKLKLTHPGGHRPSGKSLQKNFGPQKRLVSARDRKSEAKRLQKLASKERKQAAASSKKTHLEAPGMVRSDSNPGMTSAIRTLYI